MRTPSVRRFPGVPALLLALTCSLPAADWPHWRGVNRTAVVQEPSGYPEAWPPRRLWERRVGFGCTSPVMTQGKLYVLGWSGSDGRRPRGNPSGVDTLFCFDARTGRELWKQSYASRYQGRLRTGDLGAYGGPSSTPSLDVDTGLLYTLSIDGYLQCWNTQKQGRRVWGVSLYDTVRIDQRPNVGGGRRDYGLPGSPLVYGELVVVEVGARDGLIMAFDKRSGERRWSSESVEPAGHCGGPVPLTVDGIPCLATLALRGLAVIRTDPGHLGKTLGWFPWATDFACNIATPAVTPNGVLVTSAYNHKAMALVSVSSGNLRPVWQSRQHALVGTPVVFEDRIYTVAGRLQCAALATGETVWSGGRFEHGGCLVTAPDRRLIVLGRGRLSLVDAAPGQAEFRELSRVDNVVRGTCYPHVTLANGVLACKDRDGQLVCLSLRAEAQKASTPVAESAKPTAGRQREPEPVPVRSASDQGTIEVTELADHQGQASWRIATPAATYIYHKQGAAFAALIDPDGKDWISYRPTGGAAGSYRGIPNLGHPGGGFHPGGTACTSTITVREPKRVVIASRSNDGDWACTWEIGLDSATMVLAKAIPPYWVLYEGTPGGNYDQAGAFTVDSAGHRDSCATRWERRIPEPRWITFRTPDSPYALALVDGTERPSTVRDSFWSMQKNMTVFGFGRQLRHGSRWMHLRAVPARLTIALLPVAGQPDISARVNALAGATATPAASHQPPPSGSTQPLFAWAGGSVVSGDARIQLRGKAVTTPAGALELADGAAAVQGLDAALLAACQQSNELTIEAVLTPANVTQGGPARVVSFSLDPYKRNFTLGQQGDRLVLRLRTPQTGPNGMKPEVTLCRVRAGEQIHVVVSYRPGRLTCSLNGEKVLDTGRVQGDFSNWAAHHLILGDEWTGGRDWAGRLESVRLHSRALGQE